MADQPEPQIANLEDEAGSSRESPRPSPTASEAKLASPPGLMPTSDQFWAFLALIQRDNEPLYNKIRNLD